MGSTRFVARIAPAKVIVLILLALSFVVLGLWMLGLFDGHPKPPFPWAGWVAILFFGPCAAILVRRLFDRGEQIVIDGNGVYSKQWSSRTVPWAEIAAIEAAAVNRQRFLCLFLLHPDRYPPDTVLGQMMRANRALGFGDLALSATGTNRRFEDLVEAVAVHFPDLRIDVERG